MTMPSFAAETATDRSTPLFVDLDGTLVKSDTLMDSLFVLVRQEPIAALQLPLWLLKGKARVKAEVAARTSLSAATLPYNRPLLEHLRAEHANGRKIYLATASDERVAKAV